MAAVSNGLKLVGLDVRGLWSSVRGVPSFVRNWLRFRNLPDQPMSIGRLYPCLSDRFASAGVATGHYFHQDLYFARKIFEHGPERHVDVGSRIDGFVAHLLVVMPVEVVDIRALRSGTVGLSFRQVDATTMSIYADGELASLSCLHAAEHFGLGRYGDELDPRGHEKLVRSLVRVTKPRGRIYFSVPVSGRERVEFDAHRVFAPETVVRLFAGCNLIDFALVDDDGELVEGATFALAAHQRFGCGLFTFERV